MTSYQEWRRLRVAVLSELVARGWRPPSPLRLAQHQADRLLDDMARLANDRRGAAPRGESLNLTTRERVVLELVADGRTAPEIARRLRRSPETIKSQERSIRRKLGARSNAHAVALALQDGILGRAA